MKKIYLSLLLLALSSPLFAWTIGPMNYQGRLLDSAGVPVTATLPFKVRIYDAASGGTLKFSEQHNSIPVNDGVYSFLVSTGTSPTGAWDIALWNTAQLFMEIEVNGETLSPRHLMAAAPYAFQANLALTTNNALALGGKSSAWFDSTLESICVSGKGKWLELANNGAGDCLGIGSSFPGPTLVNWNTLTASSDFKNLDLTRANVSGINFNGANLTGTIFKETTYAVAGMSGANLTGTQWDAAIATDVSAYSVAATTNITKATMKNMNMSKWNLSLISNTSYMNLYSAAYLSACPSAVIGYVIGARVWECKLMRPAGSNYFMLGPNANFSTTSAAAISSNGGMILDLDKDAFDNAGTSSTSFVGVTVMQDFTNAYIYMADFSYAKLANITLSPLNAIGAKFAYSEWENIVYASGGAPFNGIDFTYGKLSHVKFDAGASADFTNAVLSSVYFSDLSQSNFTGATLDNVQMATLRYLPVTFDGTKIYGNFNVTSINATDAPSMTFKDIFFSNATVSGALTDVNFTGTISFKNTVFRDLDLCSTVFPLVDTSAPHNDLAQIQWDGAVECPDGTDVAGSATLYTGTCNNATRMTQTAVANCTAGIPGGLQ
jgi:uncharacterized protein YjbI with pentapeptide repeats